MSSVSAQHTTQTSTLLQVNDVTVWRGDNLIIDAVSFALEAGQVLQVRGANGSGKTTLLRVVCDVGFADEGHISWRGVPIDRTVDIFHSQMLYLGHKAGIKAALSPIENLRIYCTLAGQARTTDTDNAIEAALEQLSLKPQAHLACRYLSAGQQRRVSLARLVLQSATLWVLDEPLTSLDKNGLAWVESQIAQHVATGGAVLLTTHAPLSIDGVTVDTLELE